MGLVWQRSSQVPSQTLTLATVTSDKSIMDDTAGTSSRETYAPVQGTFIKKSSFSLVRKPHSSAATFATPSSGDYDGNSCSSSISLQRRSLSWHNISSDCKNNSVGSSERSVPTVAASPAATTISSGCHTYQREQVLGVLDSKVLQSVSAAPCELQVESQSESIPIDEQPAAQELPIPRSMACVQPTTCWLKRHASEMTHPVPYKKTKFSLQRCSSKPPQTRPNLTWHKRDATDTPSTSAPLPQVKTADSQSEVAAVANQPKQEAKNSLGTGLKCVRSKSLKLIRVNGSMVQAPKHSSTFAGDVASFTQEVQVLRKRKLTLHPTVLTSSSPCGETLKLHRNAQARQRAAAAQIRRGLCPFYCKTGKCQLAREGSCSHTHDKSKVAVCTKWLQGNCSSTNCRLQHQVRPELMPTCTYFLKGLCSNMDCPYLHVNVSPDAPICKAFKQGYCPAGVTCPKKHYTAAMVRAIKQVQEGPRGPTTSEPSYTKPHPG